MSESESLVRGVSRLCLKQRQVTWLLRPLVLARMPVKGTLCEVKITRAQTWNETKRGAAFGFAPFLSSEKKVMALFSDLLNKSPEKSRG